MLGFVGRLRPAFRHQAYQLRSVWGFPPMGKLDKLYELASLMVSVKSAEPRPERAADLLAKLSKLRNDTFYGLRLILGHSSPAQDGKIHHPASKTGENSEWRLEQITFVKRLGYIITFRSFGRPAAGDDPKGHASRHPSRETHESIQAV